MIGSALVFGGLFATARLSRDPAAAVPAPTPAQPRPAPAGPEAVRQRPAPESVRGTTTRGPILERKDPVAFPPLPPAGPNDWRSRHPEPAQPFAQFRRSRRRLVTPERRTLSIVPLGDVARAGVEVEVLREHLAAYYGVPAAVLDEVSAPSFTTRVNRATKRVQIRTGDVLDWLETRIPASTYGLVAVAEGDLYPEESWNFVFGQATLATGVGVFSLARMDPSFPAESAPATRSASEREVILRRGLKIVTHEVGHMFGIEHCLEGLCLMNGCNHMDEMDRAPLHMCPECLHKVVHATGADVLERYRLLETLYRRIGLAAEAEWVASRRAALAKE
jgi:archaemetzincin